jgi:hypothetical protein
VFRKEIVVCARRRSLPPHYRLAYVDTDYMAGMPSSPKELPQSFGGIVKKPSALVPLMMSLAALAEVVVSIAIFGVVHETDEGTAAHIWQLLMAGQMPILAFFAVKWLPRAPRQTLYVLALQTSAALAAMAPVFLLHL